MEGGWGEGERGGCLLIIRLSVSRSVCLSDRPLSLIVWIHPRTLAIHIHPRTHTSRHPARMHSPRRAWRSEPRFHSGTWAWWVWWRSSFCISFGVVWYDFCFWNGRSTGYSFSLSLSVCMCLCVCPRMCVLVRSFAWWCKHSRKRMFKMIFEMRNRRERVFEEWIGHEFTA